MKSAFVLFCLVLAGCTLGVFAQYENVRCKCLCPDPGLVSDNFNRSSRKLYIGNGPPDLCNCDNVVLPRLGDSMQPKAREFCPRCQCKYESRDIYMIRFSVILIIGSISFLLIYMFFLMILDPWIHKHNILRNNYQEHFSEEVSLEAQGEFASRQMFASPSHSSEGMPKGVLDRVGHSQTKWQRRVKEQRRNIYDNHTMLN